MGNCNSAAKNKNNTKKQQQPKRTTRALWKPASRKAVAQHPGLSYLNPDTVQVAGKPLRWDCDTCGCSNSCELARCFGCRAWAASSSSRRAKV